MTDYYRVLGLPPAATVDQVKAAYRRRALRYHPDKHGGSRGTEELFKSCSEAYATLVDAESRAKYDTRLLLGRGPRELVSEVVGELLGAPHRRRRKGADLRHTIELSLEDCTRPLRRELRILIDELCYVCQGQGGAVEDAERCPDCDGSGELGRSRMLSLPRICPRCAGRGVRIVVPCSACDGVGMVERTRRVPLALPPGLSHGHVEVLRGQGAPGLYGAPDGDLHLLIKVRPHPFFRARGPDLELELPVGIRMAALGGVAEVPTLQGTVEMKVPAGTQSGTTFRLRDKGLPTAEGRGDLLLQIVVETPVRLDAGEASLLEQLESTTAERIYPRQQRIRRQLTERRESDSEPPPTSETVAVGLASHSRDGTQAS